MTDSITALLQERGNTHGEFRDNSRVSQQLKNVLQNNDYKKLAMHQIEALDMICHKIGRILSGNPDFKDHWDDIAGYARLVSERLPTGE